MRTRIATAFLVTAMALVFGACATVHNLPLNAPSANPLVGIVRSAVAAEADEFKHRALPTAR